MSFLRPAIFFTTLLLCINAMAQTQRIAQAKQRIDMATSPAARANAILALCADKYSLHGDTMKHYALQAKAIAKSLNDAEMDIKADYFLGYSYLTTGHNDSAKALAEEYVGRLSFAGHPELYADFAILKAFACYKGNQPREAMKTMYELRQLTRADSTSYANIEATNMISMAYSGINQYEESSKWQYEALKINANPFSSRRCTEQLARTWMGLSISYMHLFESRKEQRFADSSIHYASMSDTLCKKQEILFFYCQSQILQGYYYSYAKKPDLAEAFLQKGLETRKYLGDPVYIASDMSVLGTFYSTTGQPEKGIAICQQGIELCRKYQLTSQLYVLLYNALAQNYEAAGDHKRYGETLKQLLELRDSITGKTASEEITKLQANYELKQGEITIARQRLDLTRKNYLFFGLLALAILAACIAGVIFFYYKKKQQLRLRFIQQDEKRLAELSIKEAEEKQRRHIAAELHDNIGAQVSFINSNIDWLMDSPVAIGYEEQKQRLAMIHETSKDLMRNLRETLWALNREEITLDELADKLKMYIQVIARVRPGTKFKSEEAIQSPVVLNPVQALNIFRIMQEAATNILKHSMASEISLQVIATDDNFTLTLKDNGQGFDPDHANEEHYGLKNMRHRASEAGIMVKLWSAKGSGTTIEVSGSKAP